MYLNTSVSVLYQSGLLDSLRFSLRCSFAPEAILIIITVSTPLTAKTVHTAAIRNEKIILSMVHHWSHRHIAHEYESLLNLAAFSHNFDSFSLNLPSDKKQYRFAPLSCSAKRKTVYTVWWSFVDVSVCVCECIWRMEGWWRWPFYLSCSQWQHGVNTSTRHPLGIVRSVFIVFSFVSQIRYNLITI